MGDWDPNRVPHAYVSKPFCEHTWKHLRRAPYAPLFCLLILNLFIFLGSRYMRRTVCLSLLLNLKCLTGMWQVLFLIYSLWKSHQGLERIIASCGWPRHEGQLSEYWLNDERRQKLRHSWQRVPTHVNLAVPLADTQGRDRSVSPVLWPPCLPNRDLFSFHGSHYGFPARHELPDREVSSAALLYRWETCFFLLAPLCPSRSLKSHSPLHVSGIWMEAS